MSDNRSVDSSHSYEIECDGLSDRINMLCDKVGNASELARLAGVSDGVIRKWRAGVSEPTASKILALATAASVSVTWLITGANPQTVDLSGKNDSYGNREDIGGQVNLNSKFVESLHEGRVLSEEDLELIRTFSNVTADIQLLKKLADRLTSDSLAKSLAEEFALVPGYNIQVAAGAGSYPLDEKPSRHLAFRRKWLRHKGLHEKDLALVFVHGDSMEPTISDNNTVMIDTSKKELHDGAIYVLRTDNHLIVKRVQRLLGDEILLISDNKAYQPIPVDLKKEQNFQVIGKVEWIGKDA